MCLRHSLLVKSMIGLGIWRVVVVLGFGFLVQGPLGRGNLPGSPYRPAGDRSDCPAPRT